MVFEMRDIVFGQKCQGVAVCHTLQSLGWQLFPDEHQLSVCTFPLLDKLRYIGLLVVIEYAPLILVVPHNRIIFELCPDKSY